MRIPTALLSAAALVVGIGGGSVAYQLATTAGPATSGTSVAQTVDQAPVSAQVERGTRFGFAPCEPPAVQRGKACVTDVVRTVSVPGSAAADPSGPFSVTPPAPAEPVPAPPAPVDDPAAYQQDDDGYDDYDDELDDDWDDDTGTHGSADTGTHGSADTGTHDSLDDDDGGTQTRTRTGHDG